MRSRDKHTNDFSDLKKKIILLNHRISGSLAAKTPISKNEDDQDIYVVLDDSGSIVLSYSKNYSKKCIANEDPGDVCSITLKNLSIWADNVTPTGNNPTELDTLAKCIWSDPKLFKASLIDWESGPISNSTIQTNEFGIGIGYSRHRIRNILDNSFQMRPTFHAFAFAKAAAQAHTASYGGAYFVYRMDNFFDNSGNSHRVLTRCVLSVRYPISYKNSTAQRIRCKLIAPRLSESQHVDFYKYDGYFSPGAKGADLCTWLFQQRHEMHDEIRTDVLLMHTIGIPDQRNKHVEGVMQTQHQGDRRNRLPKTSNIVISKCLETKTICVKDEFSDESYACFGLTKNGGRNYVAYDEHEYMRDFLCIYLATHNTEFNSETIKPLEGMEKDDIAALGMLASAG